MQFVREFQRVGQAIPCLQVGGKNASLGEMIKAGIRVPPGFAVTTEAYIHFIDQAGIQDDIQASLSGLNVEDVASLDRVSNTIQNLIQKTRLTVDIQAAVEEGYDRLCENCGERDLPVAVRSSATAEDLPTASFAGQQDTYLWVRGGSRVTEHVQRCWASLFTPAPSPTGFKTNFPTKRSSSAWGFRKWSIPKQPASCSPSTPPTAILPRSSSKEAGASARPWFQGR